MFVVEVGSVLTTALLIDNTVHHRAGFGFNLQITLWLWFTVLFANFAEAMAEGRGKAQADTLRKAKGETIAQRYTARRQLEEVASGLLRAGDIIYVAAGQLYRRRRRSHRRRRLRRRVRHHRRIRSGHPRSRRRSLRRHRRHESSLRLDQGPHHFQSRRNISRPHDRAVEGASRQKTPNEIALSILLSGLTIVFLLAVVTLQPFACTRRRRRQSSCSSRCWSASFPPPLAACSPPSASQAWIAWCNTTCWP